MWVSFLLGNIFLFIFLKFEELVHTQFISYDLPVEFSHIPFSTYYFCQYAPLDPCEFFLTSQGLFNSVHVTECDGVRSSYVVKLLGEDVNFFFSIGDGV